MTHFFCSPHDEWVEGRCGGCYSELLMARLPLSPPTTIPVIWDWGDVRLYCKDCGEAMDLTLVSESRNSWRSVGRQSQCNICYLSGSAPPAPTGPLSPPTPTEGVPVAIGPLVPRSDDDRRTARLYQFTDDDVKLIEECPWIAQDMYFVIDEYQRYLADGA